MTAPSRKRQKKTDSRVAELEKKIDALTASLHATKAQASESDDDSLDDQDPSRIIANRSHRVSDYSLQGDHRPLENARSAQKPSEPYQDTSEGVTYQPTMGNERKRRLSQYPDDEPGLLSQEISSQHLNAEMPANVHSSASNTRPPMHNGTVKPMSSTNSNSASPTHEYADVVDRKILDAALASQIFQHYTQNMAGHMPLVVFPPEISAGTIRKTKPTLFLAILSVASGQDYPDIQRILAKEILRAFADRVVYKGEKSLELIQALQVVTIWYWPEDNREAQTYQLIHMAAVMAVDLGIGRRTKGGREPYHALWKDYPRMKPSAHADDNVEAQRAWLGCYLLCAK